MSNGRVRTPAMDRFVGRLGSLPQPDDGCWIWPGSQQDGYGYVSGRQPDEARMVPVRRLSHQHFIGPVPEDMIVSATCSNKLCWRPAHLILRDIGERTPAMTVKGPPLKLSAEQRASIVVDTRYPTAIAKEYGVSVSMVKNIKQKAKETKRFITTWRKKDAPLDWDHYVSEDLDEAEKVVANLKDQGVHQYATYPIGARVTDLSSKY